MSYSDPIRVGRTQVDFGDSPGAIIASVLVPAPGIVADSTVHGWIIGDLTLDHTAAQHREQPFRVTAGEVVPGVGFTIYAQAPLGPPLTGKWSVGWLWR